MATEAATLGTVQDLQRVKTAETDAARRVEEAKRATDAAIEQARAQRDAAIGSARAEADTRRDAAVQSARAAADEEAARIVAEGAVAVQVARAGTGKRPRDRADELRAAVLGPFQSG